MKIKLDISITNVKMKWQHHGKKKKKITKNKRPTTVFKIYVEIQRQKTVVILDAFEGLADLVTYVTPVFCYLTVILFFIEISIQSYQY